MKPIKRFFAAPVFEDEEKSRNAYLLNFVTIAYFLISSSAVIAAFFASPDMATTLREALVRTLPLLVVLAITQILMRIGRVNGASFFLGLLLWLTTTFNLFVTGGASSSALFVYILVIMVFGLLSGRGYAIMSAIASFVMAIVALILENQGLLPAPLSEQNSITAVFTFFVVVFLSTSLLYLYRMSLDESMLNLRNANLALKKASEQLEQRVTEATRNLALAAEVGHRVSILRNIDPLLKEAVDIIRERFDLYYTQVYLVDPTGRSLILRAGTGEVGQILLQRGHRLPIDTGSLNGIAATEKHAVVVENTATSPIYRPNPLLPDTRSEIAVPLLVGDQVVGVLDMQSAQPGALSQESQAAFEALAGSLAIAIANATLFEQVEAARISVEEQARRQTSSGWQDFLDAIARRERVAFTYDREKMMPLTEAIPDSPEEALVAPIQVAGATIGKLLFERERAWTRDDQAIVEAVSRQVAQQIDNLRLLAQAEQYQFAAQEALRQLTREGWAQYQDILKDRQVGFLYSNYEVKALAENPTEPEISLTYPIKVHDEMIGHLDVLGVETLSEEDAELVDFVNEQLSTHLENLRLSQQTQAALSQTELLYEIGRQLNQAVNEEEILAAISNTVMQIGCKQSSLMYIDQNSAGKPEWLSIVAAWSRERSPQSPVGTRFAAENFPLMSTLMSNPNEPLLISDVRTDPNIDDVLRGRWLSTGIRAMCIIPLGQAGQWQGLLTLGWGEAHEFSHQEESIFEGLVSLVTPAVQSQRLFKQAQSRTVELDILNEMGRTLTSLQDEQAIYETIFEYAGKLMDVSSFHIAIYHADKREYSLPILTEQSQRVEMPNQPAGNGLTDYIIKTRQPLLIRENVDAETRARGINPVIVGEDLPTLSWLGVPLVFQDRILGVVAVQSDTIPGLYTEHDRDLLTAIASQAAIALENANVFRQTQQQAEYEAMINQISQRIQSTTNVENAMQVAIRELGRALGAKRTNIQLGLPDQKIPGS